MDAKSDFLSARDLRNRGWTITMIQRFLGECDDILPVDHFANFSGKAVWRRERVEKAEMEPDFIAWMTRLKKRRSKRKSLEK